VSVCVGERELVSEGEREGKRKRKRKRKIPVARGAQRRRRLGSRTRHRVSCIESPRLPAKLQGLLVRSTLQ